MITLIGASQLLKAATTWLVGALVAATPLAGALVFLAIGAFYVASRAERGAAHRAFLWGGIAAAAMAAAIMVLLPVVRGQQSAVTAVCWILAAALAVVTRILWVRRYFIGEHRHAPPFGRRWVAVLLTVLV